jgi:hypothetical protein
VIAFFKNIIDNKNRFLFVSPYKIPLKITF